MTQQTSTPAGAPVGGMSPGLQADMLTELKHAHALLACAWQLADLNQKLRISEYSRAAGIYAASATRRGERAAVICRAEQALQLQDATTPPAPVPDGTPCSARIPAGQQYRQAVTLTTPGPGTTLQHLLVEGPRTAHAGTPRLYLQAETGHAQARMYPTAAEARSLARALLAAANAADAAATLPVPEVIEGNE